MVLNSKIFLICYFIFFIVGSIIRSYFKKGYSREDIAKNYSNSFEFVLVMLPSFGMFFLPMTFAFTDWFKLADYQLSVWYGIAGCLVFTLSLWLLYRSHADLKKNWSPLLEINKDHELITNGVFKYIRHPMYAAHFGWGIAQILLLWNWIVGPSMLILMLPLYLYRIKKEEEMMIQNFAEYSDYKKRTGRIFPRINKRI
ncbi:protein-S-isoprenylcysteine O-methyltransferase [Candidatus Cloacimonadota bacterium]